MTFQPGDIVVLKSGGPPMTVNAIVDGDLQWDLGMNRKITAEVGDVLCDWKERGKTKQAAFRAVELEVALIAKGKP